MTVCVLDLLLLNLPIAMTSCFLEDVLITSGVIYAVIATVIINAKYLYRQMVVEC